MGWGLIASMGLLGSTAALARGDALQLRLPHDASALRAQEQASCLPGELATWGDGRDRPALSKPLRLVYQHEGAPPWFSAPQVLQTVLRAAEAWSDCGINAFVRPAQPGEALPEGSVLVHWSEPGSAGSFGLAHLGQRSLSLGRGAFELLRQRNPRHPADEVLQMVVSHELGHFYGLMGHSRRCADVMSYYTNARGEACFTRDGGSHRRLPEYRALLPTACDIARCRAANGLPGAPAAAQASPRP